LCRNSLQAKGFSNKGARDSLIRSSRSVLIGELNQAGANAADIRVNAKGGAVVGPAGPRLDGTTRRKGKVDPIV
jgi:hypothetical protein